ncbi:MAG TPA: hypothetical protein VFL57_08590 [Bryobacteraceae bacterium]|nr:hypothetical protein [Bryobacteraceae bacterium]
MASMRTLLPVAALAAALAMPGIAKDKGKHQGNHDGWQSRSRSADWDRRTDTEWRRYTQKDLRRRTTEREMRHGIGRMRGLDSNGDGIISRGEWRGNDQSFSRHDRDGDGLITSRDRDRRYTQRSSRDNRYTRRNDRFRSLDRNGDGIISQDEWQRR